VVVAPPDRVRGGHDSGRALDSLWSLETRQDEVIEGVRFGGAPCRIVEGFGPLFGAEIGRWRS
jgi:hypothetical protein